MHDKFQGCILGLAIGDALGAPTEFLSLDRIRARYGPDGIADFDAFAHHPPGTYTDDTQMSLAVAVALIEAGSEDLDTLMSVMGRHFVEWMRSDKNDRAPGATCMAGCGALEAGTAWREAGVADSKGCGSAMRVAPIGLYYHDDIARVIEVASASSILTHGHPTAVAAAAGAAVAVAMLLTGTQPDELLAGVIEHTGGLDRDYAAKLRQVRGVLAEPPDRAIGVLGDAWVAEEAVADALYCFLRSPDDYRQTVLTGANTAGDSDSIACIAGAFSGAHNGVAAIPRRWRCDVEDAELLADIATHLSERCT